MRNIDLSDEDIEYIRLMVSQNRQRVDNYMVECSHALRENYDQFELGQEAWDEGIEYLAIHDKALVRYDRILDALKKQESQGLTE